MDGVKIGEQPMIIRRFRDFLESLFYPSTSRVLASLKYLNLGKIKLQNGDFEGAILDYTEAIRAAPRHASSYLNRGLAKYRLKRYDEAVSDLTQSIELVQEKLRTVRLDDPGGIFSTRDLDVTLIGAYDLRAICYGSQQKYAEALADHSEAIRLEPRNKGFYTKRAICNHRLKDYQAAIEDYNEAIQLDPDFALAYRMRGLTHIVLKDFDKALMDFTRAIEIDPQSTEAYHDRGLAYAAKGESKKAIGDYDHAIQLEPRNASHYNSRGYLYARIGDLEASLADCNEAIYLNTSSQYHFGSRGHTYFLMGRYDEALADFTKSAELKPDHQFAIAGQAVCQQAWRFAGEMDEIAATFDSAGMPDGFHTAAADVYRRMAAFKGAPALPSLDDVLQALLRSESAKATR